MNNNLLPCYNGFIQPYIESDGTVLLCPDGQDKPLGNLREKSFVGIWRDSLKLRLDATKMESAIFKSCPNCAIASGHSKTFHKIYSVVKKL